MKTDALAVANYFIELAQKEDKPIHLLGLVKRVYIAHGFSLALNHRGLINPRFDKVEAWKFGPVIPSVYHTFKQQQHTANEIKDFATNMVWDENNFKPDWVTPKLENTEDKKVVELVWKRYKSFSDSELVSLTHKKGTPWFLCYIENENVPIPDELTTVYYKQLIENIVNAHERKSV